MPRGVYPRTEKHGDAIRQGMLKSEYFHTPETREKIAAALRERGKDADFREQLSRAQRESPLAEQRRKTISEKQKLAWATTRQVPEPVTCPHCGKTGGAVVMKRWHFENCKKV